MDHQRLLGRLRYARLRWRLWKFRRRVVEHDYAGFDLRILIADPLGNSWYNKDWPKLPEVELLRSGRLRPGARVFDIGAHQAVVAAILARIVGEGGQVIAIEPNPHNHAVALENKRLNGLEQLEIVQAGAAAKAGTMVFDRRLNSTVERGTGNWERVEVPAVTVDSLTETYGVPDVVFIDVEGFEVDVLEGSRKTLESTPDVYVEMHVKHGLEQYGHAARDVLPFFSPEHYDIYVCPREEGNFVPVEAAEPSLFESMFLLVALSRHR
jgi:FkbM family methyltransferase